MSRIGMETSGLKRCTKCGVEKPANANYFSFAPRGTLTGRCAVNACVGTRSGVDAPMAATIYTNCRMRQ